VVLACADPEPVIRLAGEHGVAVTAIGTSGGERLSIRSGSGEAWIDASVLDLRERWSQAIPRRLSR
jgi:hypothetical protein